MGPWGHCLHFSLGPHHLPFSSSYLLELSTSIALLPIRRGLSLPSSPLLSFLPSSYLRVWSFTLHLPPSFPSLLSFSLSHLSKLPFSISIGHEAVASLLVFMAIATVSLTHHKYPNICWISTTPPSLSVPSLFWSPVNLMTFSAYIPFPYMSEWKLPLKVPGVVFVHLPKAQRKNTSLTFNVQWHALSMKGSTWKIKYFFFSNSAFHFV